MPGREKKEEKKKVNFQFRNYCLGLSRWPLSSGSELWLFKYFNLYANKLISKPSIGLKCIRSPGNWLMFYVLRRNIWAVCNSPPRLWSQFSHRHFSHQTNAQVVDALHCAGWKLKTYIYGGTFSVHGPGDRWPVSTRVQRGSGTKEKRNGGAAWQVSLCRWVRLCTHTQWNNL